VIGYLVQPGETPPFGHEKKDTLPESEVGLRTDAPLPPASPSVRHLERVLTASLQQTSGSGSGEHVTAVDVQRFSPERAQAERRMNEVEAERRPSEVLQQPSATLTPAISPRAKRVASELGIDWTKVEGSGRSGRIRERDIRAEAARSAITADAASSKQRSASISQPFEAIPVTLTRQTIAQRMLTSARSTAPVTLTTTIDAANLVNLRNQFKSVAPSEDDVIPSFMDFLVKLAAIALRKHPLLNARWTGEQILVAQNVHIGIAVDTDEGLLVPVIHDVPGLSLKQVAARSLDLIARARQRRLQAEEMQGGTFTITNLGPFAIDAFTPIINYPECAILGVGRIQRQPVVIEDRIVPGERLTLSLTFDHRIVDGAPAARFLEALGHLIENPGPPLMA
jgi:pyruvate dehydrogenase E2 component (dihydrolipoamide acetyltransferase)